MKDGNSPQENVVRFPKGGKTRDIPKVDLGTDDPLESLLNEFEEISKELENEPLEGIVEKSIPVARALESLPTVTTKKLLPEDILARQFTKSREFQARMELLHEVNKRIKYYLDEVEMFLPKNNQD